MDNNTNKPSVNNEVVNGQLTSESYNTYSALRNPRQNFNIKSTILCLVLISSLLLSTIIFIASIRTAYFNRPSESTAGHSVLKKTMSSYDSNSFIKIETVTKDIADVFGIPIGVKVIGISEASYISTGLKINDIIVKVSGKPISSINEFNTAINNLSAEEFLTYTVYRNGSYQVVNPYDVEE